MFAQWTICFQTNQNDDDGRTAHQLFIRNVSLYVKKGVFVITVSPMVNYVLSIAAGILVLIFPTILNYIVALYLIIVGVFGILSRIGGQISLLDKTGFNE